VRRLASDIGESAAGISDLRANGGWRYRLALFSDRLGALFDIRYQIYRKKFFMKFLNNLITQMTPFLFYSAGGILAIRGEITVGALVAALGAYKDLSSPWKELLFYYNQVQDMSLRWEIVTERFAPRDMIPQALFDGEPTEIPHLIGEIAIKNVTVRDQDGNNILEDINLTIPPGTRVAIQSPRAAERTAVAQLLTREILPTHGSVTVAGHPLDGLHQAVIAARVGYAHSRPYLFDGTLGDNLLMPLKPKPRASEETEPKPNRDQIEAQRAGNSVDRLDVDWVDPELAGLADGEDIRDWWFQLVEAMGIDEFMFRRTLRSRFDPLLHPVLADEIVRLRGVVFERLKEKGLENVVHRYDPDSFNPAIPLGGNLLYATTSRKLTHRGLTRNNRLADMMHDLGLAKEGLEISAGVIETLNRTFGRDGTDHPLFRRLGMDADLYQQLCIVTEKRNTLGQDKLTRKEESQLLTVPFLLSAEQIGPGFPDAYKDKILALRKSRSRQLLEHAGDLFVRADPNRYAPRMTVVENAIFGHVSMLAGARAKDVEDVVAGVLKENGLRQEIAAVIYDLPTGLGGTNLPTVFQERAAFSRAGIKRPDILILDKALASHDSQSRLRTRQKLRALLPKSIMIFMEDHFDHPEAYDLFIEIKDGRIDGSARAALPDLGKGAAADLNRKLDLIASTDLFANLGPRNQRLLAFSAQWFDAEPGQVIFSHDQVADAVYLCLKGQAELRWPNSKPGDPPVTFVGPGRLIGDMAVITNDQRSLDLVAVEETSFLRIGAEEFRAVIENDATVALKLLQAVTGHLTDVTGLLRMAHVNLADFADPRAGPLSLDTIGDHLDD